MPLVKLKDGWVELSGKEYEAVCLIRDRINNGECIEDILKNLDPLYASAVMSYPTTHFYDSREFDLLHPVHFAAMRNNIGALKQLAEYSVNFTVFTAVNGQTPLHLAAVNNHPEIIKYLVEGKEAKIPAQKLPVDIARKVTEAQNGFYTPLVEAAIHGKFEAAQTLVALGANVNYETNDKRTPLEYACLYGFSRDIESTKKIVSLLLKHGAKKIDEALKVIYDNNFLEWVKAEVAKEQQSKKPSAYITNSHFGSTYQGNQGNTVFKPSGEVEDTFYFQPGQS